MSLTSKIWDNYLRIIVETEWNDPDKLWVQSGPQEVLRKTNPQHIHKASLPPKGDKMQSLWISGFLCRAQSYLTHKEGKSLHLIKGITQISTKWWVWGRSGSCHTKPSSPTHCQEVQSLWHPAAADLHSFFHRVRIKPSRKVEKHTTPLRVRQCAFISKHILQHQAHRKEIQ